MNAERLPYQAHSPTSREAAESCADPSEKRARVLGLLRKCYPNGLTDEEMQRALNMNPSTQRPRRIELVRRGVVCDSGKTRLTRSKRSAVVWVAVQP